MVVVIAAAFVVVVFAVFMAFNFVFFSRQATRTRIYYRLHRHVRPTSKNICFAAEIDKLPVPLYIFS